MHDYEVFVDTTLRITHRSFKDIIKILAYIKAVILISMNTFALDILADLAAYLDGSLALFITSEDAFLPAYYLHPIKNAHKYSETDNLIILSMAVWGNLGY